jgi:hypothetical protein
MRAVWSEDALSTTTISAGVVDVSLLIDDRQRCSESARLRVQMMIDTASSIVAEPSGRGVGTADSARCARAAGWRRVHGQRFKRNALTAWPSAQRLCWNRSPAIDRFGILGGVSFAMLAVPG